MANYIDGFVFPIARKYLEEYKQVAQAVAEIWKEHGALEYHEYLGESLEEIEGIRSFPKFGNSKEGEIIIFGWVSFASKEERNLANERVAGDPRMAGLVGPLTDPSKMIFDASRMVYGGFESFIQLNGGGTN
ncbi:MAG: DUF1428 family protein [Bacteroidota bacterium]